MNIFDLRVRPPYKSFLTMGLYRNLQKNIQFSQKLGTTYAQAAKEQSMDLFFKEMDDAGVSQCGIPGRKSKADCVDNDDIAELVSLYPNRFLGFPAIDPLDKDAKEEILRYVIRGNCTGIIVEPGLNIVPMYADDTHIFPIYEMCEDTTGFRYETLTDDPQVKKAVDDIILDFAGEENPNRVCDYGLTEKGMRMLRDAANPSLPHTYAWFVLTECNTAQEQLSCELTLEEAIQIYRHSDTQEKRLGVTKDSIATVDIVHMSGGEQRLFLDYQKLESFKSDPVIYEAVGRLHEELVQNSSAQNMSMGGM